MPLYPDLSACGIKFMHLSFHVSGGLERIDTFWEERGLDRSKERLLFAGYTRGKKPHTVYVKWARSHEGCSDVSIGLEARPPSHVFPRRPRGSHRLRETDLRDFIDLVRGLGIAYGGMRVHYGYPWRKSLESMLRLPRRLRPRRLTLDVLLDDTKPPVLSATYEKRGDDHLLIIEPAGRLPFPEDANIFAQPYQTACLLAESLKPE